MAGNDDGPWGGGSGGGNRGDEGGERPSDRPSDRPGKRPGQDGPQLPEIEQIVRKGQEHLRVLMGGGSGGGNRGRNGAGGPHGVAPKLTRGTIGLGLLAVVAIWLFASFYTVKPEERSVELFLGKYYKTGGPGLNFAPWPFVTKDILVTTREQTVSVGSGGPGDDKGLMLTGDENIVDIDFQTVWNIKNPPKYLFSLKSPKLTIQAVAESAMREIISQSELAPILNRDRGIIAQRLQELIQKTLDSYGSGINIVRVNFDRADPPKEVIAAFLDVQAAEQERDQLKKQADAYANKKLAEARGQSAQLLEEAEGYRAQVVNEAEGEASRFTSVLTAYRQAPKVTRKRLYLETMEKVLGNVDKIILDQSTKGAQGVVPYLSLNELRRNGGGTK